MIFRAWLSTGRYVLVTAPNEDEARRKLTRGQRRNLSGLRPLANHPTTKGQP